MKLALSLLFLVGQAYGAFSACYPIVIHPVATASSNFPTLIVGRWPYMATVANSGLVTSSSGFDIVFKSDASCTTTVPFEIDNWSATDGSAAFWVQATLSTSVDVTIYVGVGDAGITTSQQDLTGLWGSTYDSVWHFGTASSLVLTDSGEKGVTLTNPNSLGATAGWIGGGPTFTGSQQLRAATTISYPLTTAVRTLSCWVRRTNGAGGTFFGYGDVGVAGSAFAFYYAGTTLYLLRAGLAGAVSGTFDDVASGGAGAWHYIVGIVPSGTDTSTWQIFMDGVSFGTSSGTQSYSTTNTDYMIAGNGPYGGDNPTMRTDECRVNDTAKPVSWLLNEYNNARDPISFFYLQGNTADFAPHDMNTNSTPATYTASASSEKSGFFQAFEGFDGYLSTNQYWVGTGSGVDWLKLDIGSGKKRVLGSYAVQVPLTGAGGTAYPKNWTMEGSNDNSTWAVLDTETNQTSWGDGEKRTYTGLSATRAYRYFRLNITANNGAATDTSVGELYLYLGGLQVQDTGSIKHKVIN